MRGSEETVETCYEGRSAGGSAIGGNVRTVGKVVSGVFPFQNLVNRSTKVSFAVTRRRKTALRVMMCTLDDKLSPIEGTFEGNEESVKKPAADVDGISAVPSSAEAGGQESAAVVASTEPVAAESQEGTEESAQPVAEESQPQSSAEVTADGSLESAKATEVKEASAEEELSERECADGSEKEAGSESAAGGGDEIEVPEVEEHRTFDIPETEEGIMERMEHLAAHPEQSERMEIVALRKAFYRLHSQGTDGKEGDGEKEEDEPLSEVRDEAKLIDEMTYKFQSLLGQIKQLRAKLAEEADKQKQLNLEKRQQVIEKIKALLAEPESVGANYQTFRGLQEEWKAAKPMPQQVPNDLWHSYQYVTEQYYDLLKENNALRDYDLKRNLEKKLELCEAAEKLAAELEQGAQENALTRSKLISAVQTLQHMHDAFREIGPVDKSKREEVWTRFKAASTCINRHHAHYFEEEKQQEKQNLQKKTELCEAVEAISTDGLRGYGEWNKQTAAVQALQAEWRKVGRATRKQNQQVYERFRAACDRFFQARNAYFKQQKKMFAENAQKKQELIEKVEALKDSEDWRATAAEIMELQKEWKEIGPVARKAANAMWERFNGACNYFFDRYKGANSYGGRRGNRWSDRRGTSVSEGEGLQRKYQQLKAEIATFENNVSFLTTNSKSGSAIIEQMKQRIGRLKAELAALDKKIKEKATGSQPASEAEVPSNVETSSNAGLALSSSPEPATGEVAGSSTDAGQTVADVEPEREGNVRDSEEKGEEVGGV